MKLVETEGLIEIDKREIDELIAAKIFIGLNKSPRSEKIIVSLTSYKPRINDVKYTIYSLLNQSLPPDKLILWLDEDSFPRREKDVPPDLLELRNFGLTIDWCENLRPYKKLIPALEKYPDDIIVTSDDDIFYKPDWLKILYEAHLENPDCVIAHRAHRIRLDKQGNLFPYRSWQFKVKSITSSPHELPRYRNFATGAGGILYAGKFFKEKRDSSLQKKSSRADVFNRDLFLQLVPLADDIWFWAMAVLNNTKIVTPINAQRDLIYVDAKRERGNDTLWRQNRTQNNVYLRKIMEHYPALLEKLICEAAEFKPYISVVMPIKNTSNVDDCFKNNFDQCFPEFELIFVNIDSRLELQTLPMNFHLVNYPGGSFRDALKLGLQKAAGKYVLFAEENSAFLEDAIEKIAQLACDSEADVIHFSGHMENEKFISDDKFKFEKDTPTLFDSPRQSRAVFWLKNNLSRRLDTKIFKREFLTKHDINFDGGISEFMFHALIQAEKYLLVPQAFCSIRNWE